MQLSNNDSRWGIVAQSFHWLIALLILAAWATHFMHELAPEHSPTAAMWMNYHKSCGITVFFLFWLRLVWRLSQPAPKPVIVTPWQDRIARLVHLGLYIVMIAMPVTGILITEYGGHPASWFGLFTLPGFVTPDKPSGHLFHFLHTDVFWLVLLGLVGLHVAAALWHQFVVKDGVLGRMLPWGGK